jgi:hypothetical protein
MRKQPGFSKAHFEKRLADFEIAPVKSGLQLNGQRFGQIPCLRICISALSLSEEVLRSRQDNAGMKILNRPGNENSGPCPGLMVGLISKNGN